MQQLGRAGSAALLLLALGSCQSPPHPLDLVAQDGKLLFWTKVERRWFVWPHRPDNEELCSLDVWAGREWIWRVKLIPCRKGALPIPFGTSGPGLRTLVPAKALQSGVTYVARAGADWEGWMAFRLDAGGSSERLTPTMSRTRTKRRLRSGENGASPNCRPVGFRSRRR